MNKDLLDDQFGRFRELPVALAGIGHHISGTCLSYKKKNEGIFYDGPVCWQSLNVGIAGSGIVKFIIAAFRRIKGADLLWAGSDSIYGVIACVIGKINKVPVIFDIYDNFDEFLAGRLPVMRQMYHWAIRNSDALTTFSNPYARYLRNYYSKDARITVIENAVRKDLFRPLNKKHCRKFFDFPSDALIIGTAGALYKKREVDLLFKAYLKLSKKIHNLHLVIAGPRDSHLRIPSGKKIHDAGILSFEEVPKFLNALDIAVICYADDRYGKYCFPQKTREIMECNVPLVGARVGSLKEIFSDKPEWLYEPGSATSLAKVIENRIANRNTSYEESPSWLAMAKIFNTVIEYALNHKKTGYIQNT
jgi:glycosyltransferase involved in cell wall biosynthesis